jgi:hypothetical protein
VQRFLVGCREDGRDVDHDPALPVGERGRVGRDARHRAAEHTQLSERHHRAGRAEPVEVRVGLAATDLVHEP